LLQLFGSITIAVSKIIVVKIIKNLLSFTVNRKATTFQLEIDTLSADIKLTLLERWMI